METRVIRLRPLIEGRVAFELHEQRPGDQLSDVVSQAVYEARHHPQSYRATFAAGRVYANLVLRGAPEFEDEAQALLIQASELGKGEIMPHTALILFNYKLNQPVDPAWYDAIFYRLSNHPVISTTLVSLRGLIKCSEQECGIPVETMEKIFNLTLDNETTRLSNKRLANAETLYGIFTVNTRGDIQKGHRLFTQAVTHSPRNTEYRQNLINLLIVMGELNEAEHQLALFRTANTYSGNEAIYKMLQGSIDEARKQQTTSARLEPPPGN